MLAICCSLNNAMRPTQAKYLSRNKIYQPYDLSIDSGIMQGLISFPLSVYFFLNGEVSYTLYNLQFSILANSFNFIGAIFGLMSQVRGPMGPSMAIMMTNSVVTTILTTVFLSQIPTLGELSGLLITLIGVSLILLLH